jgi:hypothetical protein
MAVELVRLIRANGIDGRAMIECTAATCPDATAGPILHSCWNGLTG